MTESQGSTHSWHALKFQGQEVIRKLESSFVHNRVSQICKFVSCEYVVCEFASNSQISFRRKFESASCSHLTTNSQLIATKFVGLPALILTPRHMLSFCEKRWMILTSRSCRWHKPESLINNGYLLLSNVSRQDPSISLRYFLSRIGRILARTVFCPLTQQYFHFKYRLL